MVLAIHIFMDSVIILAYTNAFLEEKKNLNDKLLFIYLFNFTHIQKLTSCSVPNSTGKLIFSLTG